LRPPARRWRVRVGAFWAVAAVCDLRDGARMTTGARDIVTRWRLGLAGRGEALRCRPCSRVRLAWSGVRVATLCDLRDGARRFAVAPTAAAALHVSGREMT
jgi:hypothetical protein